MLTQREANKVFLFFPMAKTDFFCKGGPWLICLSPKYATELLMPEDQNQKIWMRGNRLNCWCPRSETKRSEWGGTGWTVDARGTKPKDLNEGEQVELLMPEERNQKIWMRGEQVELLMLEERNQKIWMRGEQIELLMPEEQNQKIWMRENRLNCWCLRIKTKRSEWGGTDWTVDARGSKPKDLNSGINSSTCSPSFRSFGFAPRASTVQSVPPSFRSFGFVPRASTVQPVPPSFRSFGFVPRASTVQPVLPHSDLLVLFLGHQQFNLFPLIQIFWFRSSGINSSTCSPSFRSFGFDPRASTVQSVPPHSDLLVLILGHQQFNLFPLIQIFWFWSSGINSSTCSPSFRSFGFDSRASTVQPVLPHSDLLVLLLRHQQFNLFPPHWDLLVSFLGHQQFNLFPLIQIFWFWLGGNRLNCWCPRSETKRSEWGRTGWNVAVAYLGFHKGGQIFSGH